MAGRADRAPRRGRTSDDGALAATFGRSIDGVISDLDGVVWRGEAVLPGAAEFFTELRSHGIAVAFATNNSGKTPAQYVARLAAAGITAEERQIVTSGVVTSHYLLGNYAPGAVVHVLGNPGLKGVISAAGFTVVGPTPTEYRSGPTAEVVVASMDRELSYEKLAAAMAAILEGADFIGTNGDPTLPTVGGALPGSGSVIAALEVATGQQAKLMGKPQAPMFAHALEVLGTAPGRTLMIGDRLDTDIVGAQRAGLRTALVLTGSTSPAEAATSQVQPDAVCAGLLDVLYLLTRR